MMERKLGVNDHFLRIAFMILAVLLAFPGTARTTVCDNVSSSFQREFNELVPKPACPPANSCTNPGTNHLTSTAYLPTGVPGERRLLVMYLASDGNSLQTTYEGRTKYQKNQKPIPAGTFKVLTVLVNYPQTIGANSMTLLENEQAKINKQHADFASSQGYSAPIVQFIFTNVSIPGSNISDPRTLAGVRDALEKWHETKNLNTSDFDFVVVLNIDPGANEGGMAYTDTPAPYFVYMGNFWPWQTSLNATGFSYIANAAYHHEIGHHWGWAHDWTPCYTVDPFITAPILFGWLDTDGDGIPEILDNCPYGRLCVGGPDKPHWDWNAIDRMATILPPEVYVKWVEGRHPHVPREPDAAEIEQVLRMMTPKQREEALVRVRKQGAFSLLEMFENASIKIKEPKELKQKPHAR